MQTVIAKTAARGQWTSLLTALRPCERLILLYFSYVTLRGMLLPAALPMTLAGLVIGALSVVALCLVEARHPRRWLTITRHWALMALILPAYWVLETVSGQPLELLQWSWLAWDRYLLDTAGLRLAIESAGTAGPLVLETAYLLLYAIPPVSLGLVYAVAGRESAERYLLVLMLGTLAAYAVIPVVPVISPRIAFPGADLPYSGSVPRTINIWMLDHLDNAVTVFPSGHVAVAFSSAFGLLRVMRNRPAIWAPAFVLATLVYVATVYGRYHYVVDGLMSIVIAAAAWWSIDKRSSFEA